jgi:hypothetical protein
MPVRAFAFLGTVLALSAAPLSLSAQGTKDEARLIFTVSAGAVAGKDLWSIRSQPVPFDTPTDTISLDRRIRSNLAIGFGGTYFPGEHLGLAVEGMLLGLGFEDSCRMVFSSGSPTVPEACTSINGATKSATAVALSVGPVLRVNSRSLFVPYARANVGVVISNQSSIRTEGRITRPQGFSDLIIYSDDHESRVSPILAFGAGFTAAVAKGYQIRWEIRDNIAGVQRVTAATPQITVIPPHKQTYKHLFSLTIGFDVVLERRPGRRY